jgi:hypothetical protein
MSTTTRARVAHSSRYYYRPALRDGGLVGRARGT